ncbi:hypothetical protein [Streptomyces sp. NPDC002788]
MSVGATVAVVVVLALGVLGLGPLEGTPASSGRQSALGLAQAALCFLARAAVAAYGICLMVPRFHRGTYGEGPGR